VSSHRTIVRVALSAHLLLASCASDGEARREERDAESPVADPVRAASDGGLDAGDAAQAEASVPDRSDAGVLSPRDAGPVDASVRRDAASDAALPIDAASPPPQANCPTPFKTPTALALRGDLGVHDPSIIESEGQYYVFFTGRGVQTKHSTDLVNWQRTNPVFAQNPAWIAQQVPGATDLWAPDISYFGGSFHLYYAVSTFGSNHSCIGHATRASLSTGSWQDRGSVICSNAGSASDDWNAIDPNVALDDAGTPWLSFGSFWSGIKLIKLTLEGARADTMVQAIAGRNGGAIEAPFVVRHCGEYYLFVSFDACCKGADSTYRIMVGRSHAIGGPYLDRSGMALTRGGGTQVLQGGTTWRGPGHNAVLSTASGDYNVYHAYAASDGHSELRISELSWDDAGWPVSAGP
jgi:arabinan endo-1,5-alpha-L-arabinosidase